MGQAAMTIGGAVAGGIVGYYTGNTGLGMQLGAMAGGIAGALLFPGGGGPRLTDLQVTGSTYGAPVQQIYGTVRLSGNCFWASDLTEKKSSSGKGNQNSGYTYRASWAVGLCEGPVSDVLRLWADGKLVYDKVTPALVSHAQQKAGFVIRVYLGTEDQQPDWVISDWVLNNVTSAPHATPAYRGLCYVVFDHCALANFSNRIPNITAEVVGPQNQQYAHAIKLKALPGAQSGGSRDYWQADMQSQLAYAVAQTNYPAPGTINEWNLITNEMTRVAPSEGIFVGGDATDPKMYVAYTSLVTVGSNGDLYFCGGANNSRIIKINGETLTQRYTGGTPMFNFGASGASLDSSRDSVGWARSMTAIPHVVTPPTVADMAISAFAAIYVSNVYGSFAAAMWSANQMTAKSDPYQDWLFVWTMSGIMIFDWQLNYVYGDPTFPGHTPLYYGGAHGLVTFVPGTDPLATLAQEAASDYEAITAYALNTHSIGDELHIYKINVKGVPLIAYGGAPINGAEVKECGVITLADVPLYVSSGWSYMVLVCACYDATDNSIIMVLGGSPYVMLKWRNNAGIIWQTEVNYANVKASSFNLSTISNGQIGWGDNWNTYSLYDTQTGALKWRGDGQPYEVSTGATLNNFMYDGGSNSILARVGGDLVRVYLNMAEVAGTPLASLISDVCLRSDLTADQIDVTRVTDTIQGYPINQMSTGADIFAQLLSLHQIDCVESDGKLKFVPRGQTSVATLVQRELGDVGGDGNYWASTRVQEMELPFYLTFKFSDADLGYQPGSAYAKRIAAPANTMFSKKKSQIEVPLVTNSTVAHRMAERLLYTLWQSRTTYSSVVGWKYLWLDCADPVTVQLDNGDVYRVRMTTMDVGADLSIRLQAASEDNDTYSSAAVGAVSTMPVSVIPAVVSGKLLVLDVPLLRDTDAQAAGMSLIYYGAGQRRTAWAGGTLFTSTDQQTYTVRSSLPAATTWGTAVDRLGDTVAPFSYDLVNTVTLALATTTETLSSINDDALLAGGNMAALGQEVFQFRDVSVNSDGTVTLSTLLRGRRGTDWATGLHVDGDTFVLLDATTMSYATVPLSQIGSWEWWSLVPTGGYPSGVAPNIVRPSGADLRPYAPLNHTRTLVGSDLVLGWTRRTRIGGDLADGTGAVPLGESYEAYEAYVLSGPFVPTVFDPATPSTFLRAFTGLTSPSCTYTAAQMAADGFNPATDQIHLVVFQMSEYVGRGFPGTSIMPAL
jgi:hypothetical protein